MGLNDIKPHKSHVHESGEFGIVDEIVSPQIRHILKIMQDNKGSKIAKLRIFGFARLIIPGQNVLKIKQEYVLSIIQFCNCTNTDYELSIDYFELCPKAINWINSWG